MSKEKKDKKEYDKQRQYIDKINFVVKKSTNKTYNIQAVAKMLGLPSNLDYHNQCRIIIAHLNREAITNKVVNEMIESIGYTENMCDVLVETLYRLFSPDSFPAKAPIEISEEIYKELLTKKKNNIISDSEDMALSEALNCKYCHCVKSLYLKNQFMKYIVNKEPEYNPYAICMTSIYKNRNITPPEKVSFSCRDKYQWYKKN